MARSLAFLEEHFSGGKPPFFGVFDANLLFLPEVGKKRNLAEQAHRGLTVRQLFDGTQNPFTCWRPSSIPIDASPPAEATRFVVCAERAVVWLNGLSGVFVAAVSSPPIDDGDIVATRLSRCWRSPLCPAGRRARHPSRTETGMLPEAAAAT